MHSELVLFSMRWLKRISVYFGLFLAAFLSPSLASAAPDYVTAWPKQVPLEKPDPVLGENVFYEHWAYGADFAKRFEGFPLEHADPALRGKFKAIVLRIYMGNLWQAINENYPKQYACELDVYFDDALSLPPLKTSVPYKKKPAYPHGITASYYHLNPVMPQEKSQIAASQPVSFYLNQQPLIFAEPLDGRFSSFGVREYHPNLLSGLSVITLMSNYECTVAAPLQNGGSHWLSLFGDRPWDQTVSISPKAAHGRYTANLAASFDPGSDPEASGYFRLPEAFSKAALPKATLIKVFNWCIAKKNNPSDWIVNGRKIDAKQFLERCDEVEQHGRILPDARYYPGKEGLQDQGF